MTREIAVLEEHFHVFCSLRDIFKVYNLPEADLALLTLRVMVAANPDRP